MRSNRVTQIPDKEQVLQILRQAMPDLQRQYRVRSLALFGSIVRGEARRGSDVDILVEFDDRDRPLSLLEFIALQRCLSDLLSVRVDLVEKTALKPHIGQRILQEVLPV